MSETLLRRIAIFLTIVSVGILLVSAVMLSIAPAPTVAWLGNVVRSIVTIGAPIVGLVIVNRQPRQRIGWLWIFYGLFMGFLTLGHGIYYSGGAQPDGYSSLGYFLLWFTEPAGLFTLILPVLLMLWFPDGQLASRRWRALPALLFAASAILFLLLFRAGPDWNGGDTAGGIVIDNPYGWLPASIPLYAGLFPFLTIVVIAFLAAASVVFRYRAAEPLVRLQLRWFVFGGAAYVILDNAFFITWTGWESVILLTSSAIVPLYIAVGFAILRYRLYDIDVIIRKTLVYGALTGLLALVYLGGVVLLQAVFEAITGQRSPVAIVISTLLIAALFSPLRRRVQSSIDRRFFRQKYNAEQVLAQFAETARDEVDLEVLTAGLLQVVQETMRPQRVTLWFKEDNR